MMEQITAFCIAGGHSGPVCGTAQDGATTPHEWRLVRASFNRTGQFWYYNPDSGAKILCCPEHLIVGEPDA